ncbi:membrane protein [Salmonella enterica subsp. enterica]|nr:membrane protein [Salmonella enterica subsp. enterica]
MFFPSRCGRGTANPLWRGLDMANYPRAGHAGGGSHCAGKNATTASYSNRCSVILLAGVGHATMRDGVAGTLQQINHALHLLCAAAWFGGLLPVVYCMRMAQGRWRQHAISAMMRFLVMVTFLWRAYCSQALATRYLSRDLPLSGRPPMDSCFC